MKKAATPGEGVEGEREGGIELSEGAAMVVVAVEGEG